MTVFTRKARHEDDEASPFEIRTYTARDLPAGVSVGTLLHSKELGPDLQNAKIVRIWRGSIPAFMQDTASSNGSSSTAAAQQDSAMDGYWLFFKANDCYEPLNLQQCLRRNPRVIILLIQKGEHVC